MKEMSWWRTPRWWLRDLAVQAKLNEKFYTHRLGCWLAAVGDRIPKRRGARGNRFGSLLLRLPLAKWAAVSIALALVPLWWRREAGRPGDLRREYQAAYLVSWAESVRAGAGLPVSCSGANLRADVDCLGDLGARLASAEIHLIEPREFETGYPVWVTPAGTVAEGTTSGARKVLVRADAARFHGWLRERIYRGSVWKLYGRFAAWSLGTLLAFWMLGRVVDWRRRVKAMDGIFRRGMRLVSLGRWNRKSIGPWWRRKKLGLAVRVSTGGGLARISAQAMTTHMLNMGKTGGGKTTLVNMLLDTAEREDWVVVCSDAKREILRGRYSEARGDWAIDPGLAVCPKWAVEREVRDQNEARALAAGVFPDAPGEMKFFTDWPQKILALLLDRYSAENAKKTRHPEAATTYNLGRWLANAEKHILPRAAGTGIASALNPKSGDQFAGMEGSLARAADGFAMMPAEAERDFCIREWMDKLNAGEQPGWVIFPTGGPTERAVKPVVTAMLEMILLRLRDSSSLAGMKRRQVLVILDEITTSFNRLNEMVTALTNLRSFGVFVVVGVHDCASLSNMYGNESAQTILGQPGLAAVYGTNDPNSAKYASDKVGKAEYWQLAENFPGKVADAHRSLNFNLSIVERALLTPDEIMALDPLQGVLINEGLVTPFHLSARPSTRTPLEFAERIIPMRAEDDGEDDEPAEKAPPCNDQPPVPYAVVAEQVEQIVKAERRARLLLLPKGADSQTKLDFESEMVTL